MDRIPVGGSQRIAAYGWEPQWSADTPRVKRTGLLMLEFSTGVRYFYFDVPDLVMDSFLMSESKGSYFHRMIRGQYRDTPAAEVERVQTSA